MAFELTQEQRTAVYDRGGTLLVSAAAGSGKTRVLVERLLDRVCAGADIDRFLVITFTNAAAAELRERIARSLAERLADAPSDRHLRAQTTLVYKAQISTIHAFCASLLREEGHRIDVRPDFRLLEEQESQLLLLEVLGEVLDARYEDLPPESEFARLVDTMSAGRDDQKLQQIVIDVRGKVQAHPDPAAWLDQQEKAFALEGVIDAGQTEWGKTLLADAAKKADYWCARMRECADLCECEEALRGNYQDSFLATADALSSFAGLARAGKWDDACAALPIPFPVLGRKKVTCIEERELAKSVRERCQKQCKAFLTTFSAGSDELLGDLRALRGSVGALFSLVRDLEEAYALEKSRRGVLDFNDLEHLAVRLLLKGDAPTPLAERLSGRYDEIMVDEYQDTNAVQNAIFDALSRDGGNLFLVGDVKQSIYRFRLADPTIFLDKYRDYPPCTAPRAAGEGDGKPRRVTLSRNFRSRVPVLDAVNDLFRCIMSEEFGEIRYDDDQTLFPGREYPPAPDGTDLRCELDVLDLSDLGASGEDDEPAGDAPSPHLLEARHIARRIREMLDGGFTVTDGDTVRGVRTGDIVILLRAAGSLFPAYARALGELDIPWQFDRGADLFSASEVQVALSLLEVIDNPRQDVPLLSVLRSPLFGFTPDQLALIRTRSRGTDFYHALEVSRDAGDEACASFLRELDALRFGAADKSCCQLLWELYDRTDLPGIYGAMDEGELRQANLAALAELARRFESSGHRGLFGFLSYLTRLREQGDVPELSALSRSGGVRILSIHGSKGLEFPVVFFGGLSHQFNTSDTKEPMLFHTELGIGPKFFDAARMLEYPTLARTAVARRIGDESAAEELRLLYVAMTRAREKLILSCTLTERGLSSLTKLAADLSFPADPRLLAQCSCAGQWVLLAALTRPDSAELRALVGLPSYPTAPGLGQPWRVRVLPAAGYAAAPAAPAVTPEEAAAFLAEDPDLTARLAWHYPHAADADIPSKLTATALKGRVLDLEAAENTPAAPVSDRAFRRPRFAGEAFGLTPAERGTALHLAMQFLDFERTGSLAEIREELARLVTRRFLTPEQGEAVDPERILAFFTSPLGREMAASGSLRREFKFSLLLPAADYYPEAGAEEKVLLQGVVDCWFETPDGITVIDFKTDRVRGEALTRRAEEYRPQLEAYERALEAVTGRKVVRRILWFFFSDTPVSL